MQHRTRAGTVHGVLGSAADASVAPLGKRRTHRTPRSTASAAVCAGRRATGARRHHYRRRRAASSIVPPQARSRRRARVPRGRGIDVASTEVGCDRTRSRARLVQGATTGAELVASRSPGRDPLAELLDAGVAVQEGCPKAGKHCPGPASPRGGRGLLHGPLTAKRTVRRMAPLACVYARIDGASEMGTHEAVMHLMGASRTSGPSSRCATGRPTSSCVLLRSWMPYRVDFETWRSRAQSGAGRARTRPASVPLPSRPPAGTASKLHGLGLARP